MVSGEARGGRINGMGRQQSEKEDEGAGRCRGGELAFEVGVDAMVDGGDFGQRRGRGGSVAIVMPWPWQRRCYPEWGEEAASEGEMRG